MKNLTIAGNIGKDAVTRTAGDTTVTSWSVAVEGRNGADKVTLWFDCSLWGPRGKSLEQYLKKGSKVTLAGDFGTREHEGKTYLTIRVDQLTLQGGKPQDDRADPARQAPPSQGSAMGGGRDLDDGDSIPFIMEWRG